MTQSTKIFLFIWFYVGWFGCIFLGRQNLSLIAFAFPLISFVVGFFSNVTNLKKISYLVVIGLLGYAADGVFFASGLISFPNYSLNYPPFWLLAMWLLFASVLPLMKLLFSKRLGLASALGAIFGTLSYYAGASFQVLLLTSSLSFIAYILFWGISFPLMIHFQRKIT